MAHLSTKTLLFAALTAGFAACQAGDSEPTTPGGDEPPDLVEPAPTEGTLGAPTVGPEARLASAMERAHFAFRARGGAFAASHSTHAVEVTGGAVRMTPFHHAETGVVEGRPLTVATRAVRRGEDAQIVDARGTSVDPDSGHLWIDRGEVREELENFDAGLEQRWHFASEPAGTGDLEIEVAITGARFAAETATGLHFGAPGQLGFRYGTATWLDADGLATPVPARFADGAITLTVPADVLVASAYPAMLDPVISAEIAVDNPVIGWTGANATKSSIASSGSGFLAVWRDGRNGVAADIFATRLSAAGAVLDPLGIQVNEDSVDDDNPVVVFVNGNYLVAWDNASTVRAARVNAGTGAVTALANIGAGIQPDLAVRGTSALLAFQNGTTIRAALYNGTTFAAPFDIQSGGTGALPTVAANPAGNYLVTWSEGAAAPDLLGRLVTPAGMPSGAAFNVNVGDGGQNDPASAFDGTNFVIAWTNTDVGNDIYAARVSAAGVVVDATPFVVTAATNTQNQPAIACGTGTCLVAWSDRRAFATNLNDIYAQRIATSGGSIALTGGDIAVASLLDEQRRPAIVAVGADYRLTWHDARHHGTDTVFTARVLADGSLPDGSGANIVTGNNRQIAPAVRNGGTWLVAWGDSRVLGNDIYGVRFNSAGNKLDPTARAISTATNQQGNPAITFTGGNFLTVWNDYRNGTTRDIYGARMTTAGVLLDAAGFAISTAANEQERPAIATDAAGNSLVVWQDMRSGNADIYGAVITPTGAVTLNDIAVCAAAGPQQSPAVAYDSVNNVYLVTWQTGATGVEDVVGTIVSTAGVVTTPCGATISADANSQGLAKVAFGGGEFFVAWRDGRSDAGGDIYGARVTATGGTLSVLDPAGIGIATTNAAQDTPDVTFASNVFVVAWTDNRNAGTTRNDIFGQVVLTNGFLDAGNFVISNNPEDEGNPALTTATSGVPAMVAYERNRPDLDTLRVGTRRMTFAGSTGQTCTADAQCTSGFCVDGRCCNAACGGSNTGDCQACSVGRGSSTNGICEIIANTGHVCRNYADTFCDVREKCDGVGIACPVDLGRRQGVNCTTSGGTPGVCPANDTTGAPHVCQ